MPPGESGGHSGSGESDREYQFYAKVISISVIVKRPDTKGRDFFILKMDVVKEAF
jgi:hypothetical protein